MSGVRWTDEQYSAHMRRTAAEARGADAAHAAAERNGETPKTNKFRNVPTDGYASKKEAKRARQLQALEAAGRIVNLQEQVSFVLIPIARDYDGTVIEEACEYVADFAYIEKATGSYIVEDTKGHRTRDYIIKRKLMLHVHRIKIREL